MSGARIAAVVAAFTFAGSVAVLLPGCGRDLEPLRKQRDSKVGLLKLGIEQFKGELKAKFEATVKTQKPDALLANLKKQLEDMKAEEAKIRLTMDDLVAFMDQNKDAEAELDFAGTRALVEKIRSEEGERLKRLETAIAGTKEVTVKVNSALAEWQSSGLSGKPGNLVGYEATGKWSVGPVAGPCGPAGLPGDQYAASSIYKRPHGCLLLRVGETGEVLAAAPSGVFQVKGDGGLVSARCNDKNCSDNSGSISLRVVLIPMVE